MNNESRCDLKEAEFGTDFLKRFGCRVYPSNENKLRDR
jgi:hypothetical protein